MSIPAWWTKASIEGKTRAIRLLNKELGASSLGVRHLPAIPEWQEAKRRLLTGDRLHRFSGQMQAEDRERREIIEQFSAIEKWRDGVTLPPDVRKCKYKKCPRFFLFRKNWRTRLYCSRRCGGNYRASKSMNRKIQKLRERKLQRVRVALKTITKSTDWKQQLARKARVSQNFITYAIRRGELNLGLPQFMKTSLQSHFSGDRRAAMIDGLGGIVEKDGTVTLICGKCKIPPEYATGAQNKAEAAYLLVCPRCGNFLGEWVTIPSRDSELQAFKDHVKQST